MLATYPLSRAVDFILYLYEQENEETLWDMWLSKEIDVDFSEFKQKNSQKLRAKNRDVISQDKVEENLDFASQFFTFTKGDLDGNI